MGVMAPWLGLSDIDSPMDPVTGGIVARASLVVELSLPLPEGVLLDFQTNGPLPRTLSLFHSAAGGLALVQRQGAMLTRHLLPAPLMTEGRSARLTFGWNADDASWSMRLAMRGADPAQAATSWGLNPMPLPMADIAALCRADGLSHRDPAVLWYGVTLGDAPPASAPWIGLSTPVPTTAGPVPAGLLRQGAQIITRDGDIRTLRTLRRMTLPARGFFAPVVLRAPFFTRSTDLLVSAEQPVLLRGLQVEYLFGEEEVLVEAGHLVDGLAALAEARRPTVTAVSLDLGQPALIEVDGCTLMTAHHAPTPSRPPLRMLHGYEALPLMALLKRLRPSEAA